MLNIKRHICLLLVLVLVVALAGMCTGCTKEEGVTKVRLNEVVHSIFYAPQYVAIEKGFFTEEGLDIELSVGQGADAHITLRNKFARYIPVK